RTPAPAWTSERCSLDFPRVPLLEAESDSASCFFGFYFWEKGIGMTPGISIEQRAKGCLFGGALGDAWGTPYEGQKGPVRFRAPLALSVSDDTLLTLAACDAILQSNAVDPARIAAHFVTWFRERRLNGLGSSTLKSLRDLAMGTHWALAGRRGEYAA